MEWSRVKNILIVLLAIVNVFLFVVYIGTTVSDAKETEELLENTVSVMQKNGIEISKKLIPINLPALYPATATPADTVLGTACTDGYFSVPTEGTLSENLRKAGLESAANDGNTALLAVNGVPIYNAKLECSGGNFTGFAVKDVKTVQNGEPYGICGLLVSAAQYLPKGTITSITQGFVFTSSAEDEIYLLPVWRVEGENGVSLIDAMNGEKLDYLQK